MQPIRFAILGCGLRSHTHAACIQQLAGEGLGILVAGADTNAERRRQWGEQWNMPMHDSLSSLLQRTDIDAVTICTPTGMHGGQCVTIAQSGRHILCEKPLELDLVRADAAVAAACKHGVVLGGIFQQRFAPGPMKVKRAIDQGFFGEIIFVHAETCWQRPESYFGGAAWRGTWALDGGALANQSVHMIDRILWLVGDVQEVLSATCDLGKHRNIEAETVAAATIRLKNGALGTITGTTISFDEMPQRCIICGTRGSAAFVGDELISFKTEEPFEPDSLALAAIPASDDGLFRDPDGHYANFRDFALAVRDGRSPQVAADDFRNVVRVLNLIYEKAGVGPFARNVPVPATPK